MEVEEVEVEASMSVNCRMTDPERSTSKVDDPGREWMEYSSEEEDVGRNRRRADCR